MRSAVGGLAGSAPPSCAPRQTAGSPASSKTWTPASQPEDVGSGCRARPDTDRDRGRSGSGGSRSVEIIGACRVRIRAVIEIASGRSGERKDEGHPDPFVALRRELEIRDDRLEELGAPALRRVRRAEVIRRGIVRWGRSDIDRQPLGHRLEREHQRRRGAGGLERDRAPSDTASLRSSTTSSAAPSWRIIADAKRRAIERRSADAGNAARRRHVLPTRRRHVLQSQRPLRRFRRRAMREPRTPYRAR